MLYRISDTDTLLLGKRSYRIKKWPQHYARIGNKMSGGMNRSFFKTQLGIQVRIEHFDISGTILVSRFRFRILRNKEVMCDVENVGGHF